MAEQTKCVVPLLLTELVVATGSNLAVWALYRMSTTLSPPFHKLSFAIPSIEAKSPKNVVTWCIDIEVERLWLAIKPA